MVLNLTLKRKWFDMILSGDKTEEYREIKPFWAARLLFFKSEMEHAVFEEMIEDMKNPTSRHRDIYELCDYFDVRFRDFNEVRFRNGYRVNSPVFVVPLRDITIGIGRPEWGAPECPVFILKLGVTHAKT